MNSAVITSPMVDVLYQSRLKDMSNFLNDDWLSPEPVRYLLSAQPFPIFRQFCQTKSIRRVFPSLVLF
jgi:hypothetical protein